MDWETTPAVAEKHDTELHKNADMVNYVNSGHGHVVSKQFATTRLKNPDLNMNLVSGHQGLRDAFSDMPGACPDSSTVSESLQSLQVIRAESPRFGQPSPALPCSFGILQRWAKLGEPVTCSSPSPGSSLMSGAEHTQASVNLQRQDTSPGDQTESSTLNHFETTGTLVAVNHLERSIVLKHGEKLIKVTNVACLDKNFNLAFISDIARNEPLSNKSTSDNVHYSEMSDHKGYMLNENSNNILTKSGLEVRQETLPQGFSSAAQHTNIFSSAAQHTNNLFLKTNDEKQVMMIHVGQGVSSVSSDCPTNVSSASAASSSPRTAALVSNFTLPHPPARLLSLAVKTTTAQKIGSTSTADSQAGCVTMETDTDNVNTGDSSNGVSSQSQKQFHHNDSTYSNCSNVWPDLINKPSSLSNSTAKAMLLPRSADSDMYDSTPTVLITKTNRVSNKSFNGSAIHGAASNTFLLTKPSSPMRVNCDKIGKAFNGTNSHSSSDRHQIPTKDSSMSIKTKSAIQQSVTFCIPSSENVLEKCLLPPPKASTLKLTSLARKHPAGPSVHSESPNLVLPLKSQKTQEIQTPSCRRHGALNILPSRSGPIAASFAGSNLKLGNSGHKIAADETTRINEDSCDQNFNTALKHSNSGSSSGVLRTLARKTEISLNSFRKGQGQFSEEIGVCSSTCEVPAPHSSTAAADGSTASRSLTLNSCTAISSSFKAFNSSHPLTLPSLIHSDNSTITSMDICDAAISPSSLDTSLVSSDTGISSSTSLSSLASKSSDGSSAAANQSPQPTCTSSTSSPTTSSAETHAAGETGRRLRVRHQRRFLPEKPRHKRQTLQDMTRPLKQWLYKHRENPYPTKLEKMELVKHSHMTLTQVSNWFANARRRLKNTVQGEDLTWERRIKDYNQFAEGNAELFSLPSSEEDEHWDSNDEFTVNGDPSSCNNSAISGSTSPSPVPALTSSLSDPGLMSATTTQTLLASPSLGMRYSPNLEEQQGAYHKYKHSILQRYLHDASQKIPVPEDEVVTSRARHRHLSSSTGSHDFEYLSTSSVSSPSHEMPHDAFDEFSEEFETIAIRRKVPDNSTTQNTEDMYWKEIGAALALASLARAHVSK